MEFIVRVARLRPSFHTACSMNAKRRQGYRSSVVPPFVMRPRRAL